MNQSPEEPSYEQQIYWQEFVQLKADACYVRDYRNALGRWVTGVAAVRAIASAGGIAAWAIWKQYAYVWACIIAVSQVVDALKNVFPFYKRREALSRWSRTLSRLFVEAQRDWDAISGGEVTDARIRKMSHQLRSKKQQAEAKYIRTDCRHAQIFSSEHKPRRPVSSQRDMVQWRSRRNL
jgi:hypothetical protein